MHRIITIHPFDPRGCKVGGIETHVRNTIKFFPDDIELVVVGVDESNLLELGKPITLKNDFGKEYTFIPVMNVTLVNINAAAKNIFKSLTFNFFFALFKHKSVLKRFYHETKSSVEIQRYEFSWFCYLNKFKYLLITHGDADPNKKLDSLLHKVWFIHKFNESFAVKHANKIISVSSEQAKRLIVDFPDKAKCISYMTVSVDDTLFKPTQFITNDSVLRIAFAGRLDEFKRPQMMFNIIKKLQSKLNGKIEFHYIGVSDPSKFKEYESVKQHVICHGFKRSTEIAELWKVFHMGIVTSVFEGWPVYVMEAICAGRPVVSLRLEQMYSTFASGFCGQMLDVNDDTDYTVNIMLDSIVEIWSSIRKGLMNPLLINSAIEDFKSTNKIQHLFSIHKSL